jgi:hypothetical protein
MRTIVGQQVSVAAASSVWNKLEATLGVGGRFGFGFGVPVGVGEGLGDELPPPPQEAITAQQEATPTKRAILRRTANDFHVHEELASPASDAAHLACPAKHPQPRSARAAGFCGRTAFTTPDCCSSAT